MWRTPLTCTDDRFPRDVDILARRMASFEFGALRAPGRLAREKHARLMELLELRLALRAGEPSATQAALAVILLFESSGEHHDARILVRTARTHVGTQGGFACAGLSAPEGLCVRPPLFLCVSLVAAVVIVVVVAAGSGWCTEMETTCGMYPEAPDRVCGETNQPPSNPLASLALCLSLSLSLSLSVCLSLCLSL